MADEVVEETVTETPAVEEAKQEELPLVDAAPETPKEEPVEAAPEEKKEPVVEPPKSDWKDKELKAKHRRNKELEREKDELRAEVETQRALLAKFNQATAPETPTVPADEVERRVQAELAQRSYVEKSNAVDADGSKAYGENWKSAVENLEILGGFDMPTMNGVLATDDPAKVLFELGKNPDNYRRIMGLPLERRIIEMSKLAMQQTTKQVSSAPAPVNPVGGRAAPAKETLTDDMPDDKWFAIRRQQNLARYNAKNGIRR